MATKNLFQRFRVELQFVDQIRGGVPKSPNVIDAWLRTRINDEHRVDTLAASTRAAMGVENLSEEQLAVLKDTVWNGFKFDGAGVYYEGRCAKAALKEAANIIRNVLGITALKSKVAERFFVEEDRIYLGKMEADGSEEGFVHAMTPQGPISALKRVDFVRQATISFTVRCLNQPFDTAKVPKKTKAEAPPEGAEEPAEKEKPRLSNLEVLSALLEYSQELGMGADRSQGHGKFKVLRINEVD